MISEPLLQHFPLAFSSVASILHYFSGFLSACWTRHECCTTLISCLILSQQFPALLAPVLFLPLPETSCSSAPGPRCRVDPECEVVPIRHHTCPALRGGRCDGRGSSSVRSWGCGGGSGSGRTPPTVAAHSVLEVLCFFKEGLLRSGLLLPV